MPHVITEQGDLGLGLTPVDESTYEEAMKDKEREAHNECACGNNCEK